MGIDFKLQKVKYSRKTVPLGGRDNRMIITDYCFKGGFDIINTFDVRNTKQMRRWARTKQTRNLSVVTDPR